MTSYYETRLKLERLLQDARALQAQAQQGGEPGAATNGLAMLLLKAQAFASSAELPGGLQLQLDSVGVLDVGTEGQIADLEALVSVLETRIDELDAAIATQSRELVTNQSYGLIASGGSEDGLLSAALARSYAELLEVTDLAQGPCEGWRQSGSVQYPELFSIGDPCGLTWEAPTHNPPGSVGTRVTKELTRPEHPEALPGDAEVPGQLSQAVDVLEKEMRALQAQLEAEQAKQRELTKARDVAWEAYTTVARKAAEVSVASSLTATLVRFASPAVEPTRPVPSTTQRNVLVAGAGGLVLATAIVLFVNYMYPGFDPTEALRRRPSSE